MPEIAHEEEDEEKSRRGGRREIDDGPLVQPCGRMPIA